MRSVRTKSRITGWPIVIDSTGAYMVKPDGTTVDIKPYKDQIRGNGKA